MISTRATRDALFKQKADIESGKLWGLPPIKPTRIPNVTFVGKKTVNVGDIRFELRQINIHSLDHCVIYFPKDKILLSGDTLEDTLTYMVEVEGLPKHINNLKKMLKWDVAKIYPNHGDPDVVMNGGYDRTFIDATILYITNMLKHSHDKDFLNAKMEDYIGDFAQKGTIHVFEPYRDVHTQNLKLVQDY